MSYFLQKEAPKREQRLNACIASGGTLSDMTNRKMRCCVPDGERTFTQNNICLLLPALGMMNSIPNSVVLMHGAVGCGSSSHGGNIGVRAGNNHRWGVIKDGTWLSTALNESDVICGGEEKLEAAIREIDEHYKPMIIFVVAGIEAVITTENQRYYKLLEPLTDCYNDMNLQRYAAVVGDSNYATAITAFLENDFGWLPQVIIITDTLMEEQQERIVNRLSSLKSGRIPKIIFKGDSTDIAKSIKEHWEGSQTRYGKYVNALSPAFVVGSSLDRPLAQELGAAHLSISFPVSNRAVIDRGYTGYQGGLRLIEDLISAIIVNR
ncbi:MULTISPECIES: nitrogenase component 1 [Pelosinus]|uniref:Oxidoreductase/nitrogenase component 1 n=1 Tax=Pelosinus fermentans B4 TaxID=1149862 RepID=I9L9N9_9FIRM|nr:MULTISPECIES: nitrogenase component 1 [Pelosinus]EIW17119.1 oxidoreductase/nitrogenase component 1 [Pelosinus fermentans B4]EIW23082.1 oxidoreductase/nitrogenase component 1 [Pelosinus fermentans A11]